MKTWALKTMCLCSHVQFFSDCKAVRCISTKCWLLISGKRDFRKKKTFRMMTDRIRIKSCLPKGDEHDFKNAWAAVWCSHFCIGQSGRRDGCRETAPEDAEARRKAVRNEHGNGITVPYWESLEAIEKRKHHGERRQAKERGRNEWYADFAVRVTKVEAARFLKRTGPVSGWLR